MAKKQSTLPPVTESAGTADEEKRRKAAEQRYRDLFIKNLLELVGTTYEANPAMLDLIDREIDHFQREQEIAAENIYRLREIRELFARFAKRNWHEISPDIVEGGHEKVELDAECMDPIDGTILRPPLPTAATTAYEDPDNPWVPVAEDEIPDMPSEPLAADEPVSVPEPEPEPEPVSVPEPVIAPKAVPEPELPRETKPAIHRRQIAAALREAGRPLSATDICRATGIPEGSIYPALRNAHSLYQLSNSEWWIAGMPIPDESIQELAAKEEVAEPVAETVVEKPECIRCHVTNMPVDEATKMCPGCREAVAEALKKVRDNKALHVADDLPPVVDARLEEMAQRRAADKPGTITVRAGSPPKKLNGHSAAAGVTVPAPPPAKFGEVPARFGATPAKKLDGRVNNGNNSPARDIADDKARTLSTGEIRTDDYVEKAINEYLEVYGIRKPLIMAADMKLNHDQVIRVLREGPYILSHQGYRRLKPGESKPVLIDEEYRTY